MAKIYLSPAAHAADNSTRCPIPCSENTHCNQYADVLERRLLQLGFEVKRGSAALTGSEAMRARVREANAWGADIYYVCHTNAGGGRYSLTLCWVDRASRQKAAVIGKYRRGVHQVKQTDTLYEIKQTKMPCLYDELFFHDNAEDCAWFHADGMAIMAEETAQALCEICGVPYAPPAEEQPAEPPAPVAPAPPKAGDALTLQRGKLYFTARGNAAVTRTGTFYLYDGIAVNGRYRVTNRPDRVGKTPLVANVSGWVAL